MTSSNIKKLSNEMALLQQQSDKYIPKDKYYVVSIEFTEDLELKDITQKLLIQDYQPSATYTFGRNISVVYSSVDENEEHYLNGSHHDIISAYCSELCKKSKSSVRCNIVEFETRMQVVSYFIWKIHNNSMLCLSSKSKKKISITDTKNKTLSELTHILQELGIIWDDISKEERYGLFYKLKKRKNGSIVVALSEAPDAREIKKFSTFIFE